VSRPTKKRPPTDGGGSKKAQLADYHLIVGVRGSWWGEGLKGEIPVKERWPDSCGKSKNASPPRPKKNPTCARATVKKVATTRAKPGKKELKVDGGKVCGGEKTSIIGRGGKSTF